MIGASVIGATTASRIGKPLRVGLEERADRVVNGLEFLGGQPGIAGGDERRFLPLSRLALLRSLQDSRSASSLREHRRGDSVCHGRFRPCEGRSAASSMKSYFASWRRYHEQLAGASPMRSASSVVRHGE
jgi:hypothetical protein